MPGELAVDDGRPAAQPHGRAGALAGSSGLDLTRPIAADAELRWFADAPLLSAPGQRFSYSSPGYVLLARIVERAADQPYASFLDREIFQPLEMAASFAGNGDGEPGLAAGHRAGTRVESSFELDTVGIGAGVAG